ncbi:fungal hydrophobin-domain-containing protein [Gymnopilus junonius]|uniref:Hydrophobin n=1 Tax=Gymnopilus junonius TaxID=109634 RepID=A0A9P5TKL6_GYMJU|nr:fungal hydrophobin-domain-containing protein [Gymnopilus junonius]
MFARAYSLFFFICALPVFASATGDNGDKGTTVVSQCNTGPVQCCNNVGSAESLGVNGLLGLLGIAVDPITAILGVDCTSVVGIANGNSCSAQPVCCTNNQFNGLINVGCSPINVNL